MFIIALLTIAKTQKQPKCPATKEWIKKMWYIYVKGHFKKWTKSQGKSIYTQYGRRGARSLAKKGDMFHLSCQKTINDQNDG